MFVARSIFLIVFLTCFYDSFATGGIPSQIRSSDGPSNVVNGVGFSKMEATASKLLPSPGVLSRRAVRAGTPHENLAWLTPTNPRSRPSG